MKNCRVDDKNGDQRKEMMAVPYLLHVCNESVKLIFLF